MSRKKRKKYRGHYCWCCERIRPNEKFSGRGHARHLCKECKRLGAKELAYRQALVNMERCLDFGGGMIRRKRRTQFNRFLEHENARIREAAEEILAQHNQIRAEFAEIRRQEEEELEQRFWAEFEEEWAESAMVDEQERLPLSENELPF